MSVAKKQVLMVTPFFHPHRGGVDKHVWRVSQELTQAGWQVTVLTQAVADQPLPPAGIRVEYLSFPHYRVLGLLSIWLQLVWRLLIPGSSLYLGQFQVLHVHDVLIWLRPILFWRRCCWPALRLVLTMHGWEGRYPLPAKNIRLKQWAARQADDLISVGQYISRHYQIRPDRVIEGAVDCPHLADWLKQGQDKIKRRVVYLGRLATDTGLPLLLEMLVAWPAREKLDVVFCGDGPLRTQCAQFGRVQGVVDPRPFLKQAQVCIAGGYLGILESLSFACQTISIYDNDLRKDYLQLSSMAAWIRLAADVKSLRQQLALAIATPLPAKPELYQFLQQASWQNLSQIYLEAYNKH